MRFTHVLMATFKCVSFHTVHKTIHIHTHMHIVRHSSLWLAVKTMGGISHSDDEGGGGHAS